MSLVFVVLSAAVNATAGPAEAPPSSKQQLRSVGTTSLAPEVKPSPRWVWYGWQILAGDATVAALATGLALHGDGGAAALVGVIPYLGGGALVHGIRHHWGRVGASLGLRTGLPGAGALVGWASFASSCEHRDDFGCLPHALVGGLIGGGIALMLDWTVLSFDRPEPKPTHTTLLPTLSLMPSGTSVGIAGVF